MFERAAYHMLCAECIYGHMYVCVCESVCLRMLMWTTYPTLPYRTLPYLHGGQHVVHGGGVGLDDLPAPAQVELQVARHSLDGGRGGMYG